jgi:hypothetical protein
MSDPTRVPRAQLELDHDRLVTWNGEPFTGTAIDEGCELSYVTGLLQGVSRERRHNGQLAESATYWQGARHGATTRYDSAGRRIVEEFYEFGVLTARRTWSSRGDLEDEWLIGPADDLYRVLELSRARYGPSAPLLAERDHLRGGG